MDLARGKMIFCPLFFPQKIPVNQTIGEGIEHRTLFVSRISHLFGFYEYCVVSSIYRFYLSLFFILLTCCHFCYIIKPEVKMILNRKKSKLITKESCNLQQKSC